MTLKTYYHYLVSITYTLRGISNFEVKNEQKSPVQTPKSFHRGGYKLARDQIGTPLFIQSVVINGYSMRWLSIISFAACFYFLKVIIVTPPSPHSTYVNVNTVSAQVGTHYKPIKMLFTISKITPHTCVSKANF